MGSLIIYANDIVIIAQVKQPCGYSQKYVINLVLNIAYHLILTSTSSYIIHIVQLLKVCLYGTFIKSAKSANHLGITLSIDDKGSCLKNSKDFFNVNSLKVIYLMCQERSSIS